MFAQFSAITVFCLDVPLYSKSEMLSFFAAQLSAASKAVLDERHEGALCQLFHGTWIKRVSLQLRGVSGIFTKPPDRLIKDP